MPTKKTSTGKKTEGPATDAPRPKRTAKTSAPVVTPERTADPGATKMERAAPRRTRTAPPRVAPALPDSQEVAKLAYFLWLERGCAPGLAEHDWFVAERTLTEHRS
jgi:hypothetical protein